MTRVADDMDELAFCRGADLREEDGLVSQGALGSSCLRCSVDDERELARHDVVGRSQLLNCLRGDMPIDGAKD